MAETSEIVPPHLNAEVYRKDTTGTDTMPYLDYIRIHKDGTTLIGCSELTGRYWNGAAKIMKNATNLETEGQSFVTLVSGNADGCFIEDSNKLLLCEDSGTVSVWSRSNSAWGHWEELISVSEHDDMVTAVECLEPALEYVTVGADCNIKVWDINEMLCVSNYLRGHSMIISGVAVKPNSRKFATCSLDRHVTLWDRNVKEDVLNIATVDCGVRCLQWVDDNQLLIGDEAGALNIVDVRNLEAQTLVNFPAPVHKILVQPETNDFAVCCDNRIISLYELNADKSVKLLYKEMKHKDYVRGMAWDIVEKSKLHTVGWDGALQTHNYKD